MAELRISVVDSAFRPIDGADLRATSPGVVLTATCTHAEWIVDLREAFEVTLAVSAAGYESEPCRIRRSERAGQIVVALRRKDQRFYRYGDSRFAFTPDESSFLVRAHGPGALDLLDAIARDRGIASRTVGERGATPDRVCVRLWGDLSVAAAVLDALRHGNVNGQVLRVVEHSAERLHGLSHEIAVRFADGVDRVRALAIAQQLGLRIDREIRHTGNGVLLVRDGLPAYDILDAANALDAHPEVQYAEPNLVYFTEADQYTPNDPLWAQVPYLATIGADHAWQSLGNAGMTRGGSAAITIAIIDDYGVSPDHAELTANTTDGTAKLIETTDFSASPIVPQQDATLAGPHGTQCAGAASAAFDDGRGLPGVAPNCHVIGAHVDIMIDAVFMSDVYLHVAGFSNGSNRPGFPAPPAQAADVISSSWGVSRTALSNVVRDCFDFLTTYGRGGKGCVLLFSIGNTGYVDFTDVPGPRYRAWPSYPRVLAVGSSIGAAPTSPVADSYYPDPFGNTHNIAVAADTRALYSPFGSVTYRKPDLVAPSSTAFKPMGSSAVPVDPIMSCVVPGTGTVNGCTVGVCNDYAATFGGTSHSTAAVAGAVALMLSARPSLNWVEVRDILRRICVRIDPTPSTALGAWQDTDGDGAIDYSRWYGAGRLDAGAAVDAALDAMLKMPDVYVRDNLADSGDVPSNGAWSESPDIWVREDATEAIPVLLWTDAPPHQNARRGQDNAVFCRVRNRGDAAATTVYVRALVTHWAGLEFTYPGDFIPVAASGAAVTPMTGATYLIGEAQLDNLAIGEDRIVKFVWPQALVPPATFTFGAATVTWHPCLLVEAAPHDGPWPLAAPAIPIQGDNNIAQRNIAIVNAIEMEERLVAIMAGSDGPRGIESLLVDTRELSPHAIVRLRVVDEAMTSAHDSRRGDMEITAGNEIVEWPYALPSGEHALVLVGVRRGMGRLRISQRRGDRTISPGYTVLVQPAS